MELKLAEFNKEEILSEALAGLNKTPKELPCKLFYDEKGSALFDEICLQDEYYPTRTEISIMRDNIKDITSVLGENVLLAELGSGSSIKTRLLLDHMQSLKGYIPIDISSDYLFEVADILRENYPYLDIIPLAADYTKEFSLPLTPDKETKTVIYFPGSTIGNFHPSHAKKFLGRLVNLISGDGGILIGVDLRKDKDLLEKAYNDAAGITSDFNLNILDRLNNTLNAGFDLNKYKHLAFFNEMESRIEMHLVSSEDQLVKINNTSVYMRKNEHIITEYSYKYTLNSFSELVSENYKVKEIWLDKNKLFSVQYLVLK